MLTFTDDQLEPEKAFGPNVKRLQDLKTKYDPDNVFWKWHAFFRLNDAEASTALPTA